MIVTKAESVDLEKILNLQYLAYQSEAVLLNDFSIPPLKQTIEEINQEYEKGIFLKAVDAGDIIGSVRACIDNNTAYIGKLIVLPERQRQGIGTKLMSAIERECAVARYELFTSDKSVRNIQLYERLGYVRFREQKVADGLTFVYLEKH
ncbi:MAG: GNAT family N-acetyltransferase [Alphaproteobacteria bacterium]|nr:GNAT family N-acetyltransferase [Alphaproteobacteria bacterium]